MSHLASYATYPADVRSLEVEEDDCHRSEPIRAVVEQVKQVAATGSTVLLLGETGVGKEFFANAIHAASPRCGRPMVAVSCAAIPAALMESELFGHERGAFTGAETRRTGRFEQAHRSTIFLDEIGDMPLNAQSRLLRVLEERTIDRLGGQRPVKVDVRIIAATNRDLAQALESHAFREDLYYRLNVFPITIPPLRERVADIAGLVRTLIDHLARKHGKKIEGITSESVKELERHSWPGNIRELRNVIERAVILATGPILTPEVVRASRV